MQRGAQKSREVKLAHANRLMYHAWWVFFYTSRYSNGEHSAIKTRKLDQKLVIAENRSVIADCLNKAGIHPLGKGNAISLMHACTCVRERHFNEEIHKKQLKFDANKIFIMHSLWIFTWGSDLMNIINKAL